MRVLYLSTPTRACTRRRKSFGVLEFSRRRNDRVRQRMRPQVSPAHQTRPLRSYQLSGNFHRRHYRRNGWVNDATLTYALFERKPIRSAIVVAILSHFPTYRTCFWIRIDKHGPLFAGSLLISPTNANDFYPSLSKSILRYVLDRFSRNVFPNFIGRVCCARIK